MMVKPMKTLELHYPMIQFLIIVVIYADNFVNLYYIFVKAVDDV